MQYFSGCYTIDQAKAEYRRLARIHHPDVGGDVRTMQEINKTGIVGVFLTILQKRISSSRKPNPKSRGNREKQKYILLVPYKGLSMTRTQETETLGITMA